MMKKWFGIFVLIIIFSSFVALADDPPIGGFNESDKEKIDKAINSIPINDDGSFNGSILNPVKSKAEQRIDAINKWLEDSAPWLSVIFGIVPAISWLFAANFYLMLLFAVFVLNFQGTKFKIFGWIVYIFFLLKKVYVSIAEGMVSLIESAWGLSWILGVLTTIGFVLLLIFAQKIPRIFGKLFNKLFKKDKMGQVLEKAESNEKILSAKVSGMNSKG